jgi:hypothetical protein
MKKNCTTSEKYEFVKLVIALGVITPPDQLTDQSGDGHPCTPSNLSENDLGKKILGLFLILISNNHESKKN